MDKLFTLTAMQFALIAIMGVLTHVIIKWAKKEIEVSVRAWFMDNPRTTVLMILSVLGSLIGMLASDTANNIHDAAQVIAVFLLGYASNSAVNKQ